MLATEALQDVRDVFVIVFAGVAIMLMAIAGLVILLIYRKVGPLLNSARKTTKNAEELSTTLASKVVKPLVGGSAYAYGLGQVLAFLAGFSKRKGGKKRHGE